MTTAVVTADFKANLKYYFDVAVNGNSVIITRPKKKNAVLISEEEYNRLQEIKDKYYISERILMLLQQHDGKMPYSDTTSPDIIKGKFKISKGAFKRALGHLMKDGLIEQKDGWTYLK